MLSQWWVKLEAGVVPASQGGGGMAEGEARAVPNFKPLQNDNGAVFKLTSTKGIPHSPRDLPGALARNPNLKD